MAPARHVRFVGDDVRSTGPGRNVVAVIGVDRYRHWPPLSNAVSDATGVLRTFRELGFEAISAHRFDDDATAEGIRTLVVDELRALREDDSLVLFFSGHGHTEIAILPGGVKVKTGYLVPSDAPPIEQRKLSTLLRLDSLLEDVSRLPARHILVIIDACFAGVALGGHVKWRGPASSPRAAPSLEALHGKRSRRVITSALDDQPALDSGPVTGHSLFTGVLVESLTSATPEYAQRGFMTGSELGLQVQRRVTAWPGSRQTPDFGALALDDRGEMFIPVVGAHVEEPAAPAAPGAGRVRRRTLLAGAAGLLAIGGAAAFRIATENAPVAVRRPPKPTLITIMRRVVRPEAAYLVADGAKIPALRVIEGKDSQLSMTMAVLVQGTERFMGNPADDRPGAYTAVVEAIGELRHVGQGGRRPISASLTTFAATAQSRFEGELHDLREMDLGDQVTFRGQLVPDLVAGVRFASERVLRANADRRYLVIIASAGSWVDADVLKSLRTDLDLARIEVHFLAVVDGEGGRAASILAGPRARELSSPAMLPAAAKRVVDHIQSETVLEFEIDPAVFERKVVAQLVVDGDVVADLALVPDLAVGEALLFRVD